MRVFQITEMMPLTDGTVILSYSNHSVSTRNYNYYYQPGPSDAVTTTKTCKISFFVDKDTKKIMDIMRDAVEILSHALTTKNEVLDVSVREALATPSEVKTVEAPADF